MDTYQFPINEIEKFSCFGLTLLLENIFEDKYGFFLYVFQIYKNSHYKKIGRITLRLGKTEEIYYKGNIGYSITKKHRGKKYSKYACVILINYLNKKNIEEIFITTSPKNIASQKICEGLNGRLLKSIIIPQNYKDKKRCDIKLIYKISTRM